MLRYLFLPEIINIDLVHPIKLFIILILPHKIMYLLRILGPKVIQHNLRIEIFTLSLK